MYELRFDGLVREAHDHGSAGFLCTGWLISHRNKRIAEGYSVLAKDVDATSNIAEYLALIEGLEALVDMGILQEPVTVYGDAKGVIRQMQGTAQVLVSRMFPVHEQAVALAGQLNVVSWTWVPRKQNKDADELTRVALRDLHSDVTQYEKERRRLIRASATPGRLSRILSGMMIFRPPYPSKIAVS